MNTLGHLSSYFSEAVSRTGKSRLGLLAEMLLMRLGPRKIGLTEYFELELFDQELCDPLRRQDFIGHRYSSYIDRRLNSEAALAIAFDKILTYGLLAHYGFPVPRAIATFNRLGRRIGQEPVLKTVEDLLSFWEISRPYPFFIKPVHGYSGVAAYGVEDVDLPERTVMLINGQRMPLDALLDEVSLDKYEGMLLQKVLRPSAEIASVFGETLGTFRLIVLTSPTSAKLHMAFWKIARRGNMVDNFSYGTSGNLIGWIDRDSGVLERVIGGFWPNNQEIIDSPETGRRMKGFVVPQWQEIKRLCLSAAVHFPGIRVQSWDVALCDDGPVLLELNTNADLQIPQVVGRVPFLNDEVRSLMG